jgi:hypothetical protein
MNARHVEMAGGGRRDAHHATIERAMRTLRPPGRCKELQSIRGIRLNASAPISEIAQSDESFGAALPSSKPQRWNRKIRSTKLFLKKK